MNTKNGGQAFPLAIDDGVEIYVHNGMTLRDYFASKVLPAVYSDCCAESRINGWDDDWRDGVADEAYAMADAMLKAREDNA